MGWFGILAPRNAPNAAHRTDMTSFGSTFDRRRFLSAGAAAATVAGFPSIVRAQSGKIRIGLMLPYSGLDARQGVALENGFRLALKEVGGNFAGRETQFIKVNDESDPAKAMDNVERLLKREKVDLVLGTVDTGVMVEMIRATRAAGVLHIIPDGGFGPVAGALCAPNVFRTSYANWQSGYAMGSVLARRSALKKVATLSWRFGAGEESVKGFRDAYLKGGGQIARELWLPYGATEFQALLTEIAVQKPDAVYAFLAGSAATRFLRNYNQSGLTGSVPLFGPGFLTEGVLASVRGAAEGVETTLHYGDGLETPKNKAFRRAYAKTYGMFPNMHAVAGYDAGLLFDAGMQAVKGDLGRKGPMIKAMEQARIDSPRGPMRFSRTHNPIHDQYLRKVVGNENRVMDIALKALDDDPAMQLACKMQPQDSVGAKRA